MRRLVGMLGLALVALTGPTLAPARAQGVVEMRLSRSSLAVGESTVLEVRVRGASGQVGGPEFEVPEGTEVLSSGRTQSLSWVNGRSTSEVVFRYELAPATPGRFTIGPLRVRAGNSVLTAAGVTMTVSAAAASVGAGGTQPLQLRVDVEPVRPYVGQPVLMRVRLILRAPLAEDPQYGPPATPGFWSESPSPPESYYAAQGDSRVQVTETRTRLYPLAPGTATIGEATAIAALQTGDDPSAWLGGRVPRREASARSAPVTVSVRPLPPGAPAAFDGAVGTFTLTWSADRERTTRDVPVTVRLDVRGEGNLPLLHTPALVGDDLEVFASTVDDSLGPLGMLGAGRRRFQWTVLARHDGEVRVPPPTLAWFDPRTGSYRSAALATLALHVDPPLRSGPAPAGFPRVFGDHPVDPGSRPALPAGWALAGCVLGIAWVLWRMAGQPPPEAAERARQREWLRAVGLARGPDFWRSANDAAGWLEQRGAPMRDLQRTIAAARYGGAAADEEGVRRRLVEQLGRALPPERGPWGLRGAAIALAVGAAVMVVACAPRGGDPALADRASAADAFARSGDVKRAATGWRRIWDDGGRAAGLAARLAWAEVRDGQVGPAATWVLRGRRGEPRDAGLAWVTERVHEGGGLVGASGVRLPVRSLEWGLLALVLGALAGVAWPRRALAAGLLALAALAAAVWPLQTARAHRTHDAVVRRTAALQGAEVNLDAGQVVQVRERDGARLRVVAGRDLAGWIAADEVEVVEDAP